MASSVTTDNDSFAFTTGAYGNRPTYLLTPQQDGEAIVLYELLPKDVARGRQERFNRKQKTVTVSTHDISEAIVGGETPDDITDNDDSVGYQWNEWCAVKVCRHTPEKMSKLTGLIEDTLRDVGVNASEIMIGCGDTVGLPEAAGVRLTLAFVGIKHVRREDKIRHIRDGIQQMSLGECYYWHSKIKSPNEPNGATALRELLAGHIN
jgi:hypothetical protein